MTKQEYTVSIPILVTAITTSLDGSALIGAFAGAVVYTIVASEANIWKRLAFMLCALIAGYTGAPMWDATHTGFPAFVISSVIILVVLLFHKVVSKMNLEHILDLIKSSRWFK